MEYQGNHKKEVDIEEDIYSVKESNHDKEQTNIRNNISTLIPKISVGPNCKSTNDKEEVNNQELCNSNDVKIEINENKNLNFQRDSSLDNVDNEKRTSFNYKYVEDNASRIDKSHLLKKFESKKISNDGTPDGKTSAKTDTIFQKNSHEIKIEGDLNGELNSNDKFDNIRISHDIVQLPDYNFLKQDLEKEVYFFFINPKSGSKEGSLVLNTSLKRLEFSIKKNYLCFIFSLIDHTLNEGIELLKEFQSLTKGKEIFARVIIGGGDGTTMNFLENLIPKGIDVQRCYYGVLPLGTGNDLSNALGFGSKIHIDSDMIKFKKIVLDFSEAKVRNIDIWKLKLKVEEDGGIKEIVKNDHGFGKQIIKDQKTNKYTTILEKGFINYFSFGYDARVGYGFDKNRTSLRCCNKFVYFWEGLKKTCCRKTLTVPGFLESFQIVRNENNVNIAEMNNTEMENLNDKKIEFFRGKKSDNKDATTIKDPKNSIYENIVLKGDPVSIICQNINFYMGGTGDIWRKSGQNLGLEIDSNQQLINSNLDLKKEADVEFRKILEGEQRFDDGKLEFLTYQKEILIGLEKISSGNAEKVYHGKGPIIIKFKKIFSDVNDKLNRVYMNIDGEYFNIVKPIELRVREHKDFPQGKIKFLSKI